jgi:hypothetical protein
MGTGETPVLLTVGSGRTAANEFPDGLM